MSAITDFSVAVLDCQACCRHFIENHLVIARRTRPLACPHCGADYVEPADMEELAGGHADRLSRQAHVRRGALHLLGQRRRKLQ